MSIVEQRLPDLNLKAGTVRCYLYYDSSLTGLTFPTKLKFLDIGEIAESIDLEGGVTDIENIKIIAKEDYSSHSEGFWYKLINYSYTTGTVERSYAYFHGTTPAGLGGKYFTIDSTTVEYYVWFNLDGASVDPKPVGKTGIEVGIATGDTTDQMAGKTAVVLEAHPAFTSFSGSIGSETTWIYTVVAGNVPDITDGDAGTVGLTVAVWTQGTTTSIVYPPVELMFTLINGANEEFLFRGTVNRQGCGLQEDYLDILGGTPTKWIRGLEIELLSSYKTFENVNILELCIEVWTHGVSLLTPESPGGLPSAGFVKFKDVILSMIDLAFGTSDANSVVDNSDIELYDGGAASYIKWTEAYVFISWFYPANGSGGGIHQTSTYYDMYPNAWELFKHLCSIWGVIPKFIYGSPAGLIDADPANNKPRIIFNTRGKSGTTIVPVGKERSSKITLDSSRKINSYSLTYKWSTGNYWFDGDILSTTASSEVWRSFERGGMIEFNTVLTNGISAIFYKTGSSAVHISQTRFWNYESAAWEVCSTGGNNFAIAMISYLYYRFTNARMQYDKEYNDIKASDGSTSSQLHMTTLASITISDGIVSRDFYLTEVRKDIVSGRVKAVLVQE